MSSSKRARCRSKTPPLAGPKTAREEFLEAELEEQRLEMERLQLEVNKLQKMEQDRGYDTERHGETIRERESFRSKPVQAIALAERQEKAALNLQRLERGRRGRNRAAIAKEQGKRSQEDGCLSLIHI